MKREGGYLGPIEVKRGFVETDGTQVQIVHVALPLSALSRPADGWTYGDFVIGIGGEEQWIIPPEMLERLSQDSLEVLSKVPAGSR